MDAEMCTAGMMIVFALAVLGWFTAGLVSWGFWRHWSHTRRANRSVEGQLEALRVHLTNAVLGRW